MLWALTLGRHDPSSAIFTTTVAGTVGLVFALAAVRWQVDGENLTIWQFGFRQTIPISEIDKATVLQDAQWKQGVGIRYAGGKEWAMLCGSREVISIDYGDRKFHFSTDDATSLKAVLKI